MTPFASEEQKMYNAVKSLYTAQGRNPILVPSTVRLEVAASTSSNQFNFSLFDYEALNFNTELRLNQQDNFTAVYWGLFAAKPGSSTAINFDLYSYGNESVFSSANTGESVNGALQQGYISVVVNNVKYIDRYSSRKFINRGFAQTAAGYGVNDGTTPVVTSTVQDQVDGWSGLSPVGSLFTLRGNANVQISFNIPTTMTAVESNQRWVLLMYGYKALDGSKTA